MPSLFRGLAVPGCRDTASYYSHESANALCLSRFHEAILGPSYISQALITRDAHIIHICCA